MENRVIEAPAAYIKQNSTVMVPLRAIAEALGYKVAWNAEKRLVMLNHSFSLTIGKDTYVDISRDKSVSLGIAPEISAGRTYVPLQFFRAVVSMHNAYLFEGQIVIDNNERMQ